MKTQNKLIAKKGSYYLAIFPDGKIKSVKCISNEPGNHCFGCGDYCYHTTDQGTSLWGLEIIFPEPEYCI